MAGNWIPLVELPRVDVREFELDPRGKPEDDKSIFFKKSLIYFAPSLSRCLILL